MKILHINHFEAPDYLNDMIFHGGRSLFGLDYLESSSASYMYRDYPNKHRLYGRGFTLYGRLEAPPARVPNGEILQMIADREFDLIVYGSVFRNMQYWDLVERVYPKDRIVFIDGEDHQFMRPDCIGRGYYFKRELSIADLPMMHPISFGIPKELIVRDVTKIREFAPIDPADPTTYRYSEELAYYREYQQASFGFTQKKAGWDCLRHYEILMNRCFPALREVEKVPPRTLVGFPKAIIREYFLQHGYTVTSEYEETMQLMMAALEQSCTTEALWHRILAVL